MTRPMPIVGRVCACGLHHDTHSWKVLPYVGKMDAGNGGLLEMRNCPCGSTLAVELCSVEGCGVHAMWNPAHDLAGYCTEHADEWLMYEDDDSPRKVAV